MDSYDSLNHIAVVFVLEDSAGSSDSEALSNEIYRSNELNSSASDCDVNRLSQHVEDTSTTTVETIHKCNRACRKVSAACGPNLLVKQMNINCNHNFETSPFGGCGCFGSYNGGAGGGTNPCGCEETYQGGLVNKKPVSSDDSSYHEYSSARQYREYGNNNYSSCGCSHSPDTYELIHNKDAQRYMGASPDRSYYFTG